MSKYTADIMIAACKEYLEGTNSCKELCEKYGIHFGESTILDDWIMRYKNIFHKIGNFSEFPIL